MAEVSFTTYDINPSQRFVDQEGRLTQKGFEIMKAVTQLVSAVTIEDGEVKTEMLESEIIRVSTLFADNVVITSKVAPNAISELTALLQVGSNGPDGETLISGTIPIDSLNNTGLLLTFTAFMEKPDFDPANFGTWGLHLRRNGTIIDSTPPLFYDDNFSYQPVASFIDPDPGDDPEYEIESYLVGGPGVFTVSGGVLNVGLLKR